MAQCRAVLRKRIVACRGTWALKCFPLALFLASPMQIPAAFGQVSTNFEVLPPEPPKPPEKKAARHSAPAERAQTDRFRRTGPAPKSPSPSSPGLKITATGPALPHLAPPFVPAPELHTGVPPLLITPDEKGAHEMQTLAGPQFGWKIVYPANSAGLTAPLIARIQGLGRQIAAHPMTRIVLECRAASVANDFSLPRRLSLERCLDIRSLLMGENVASTRIYPRALGADGDAGEKTSDEVLILPEENPEAAAEAPDLIDHLQSLPQPPPPEAPIEMEGRP